MWTQKGSYFDAGRRGSYFDVSLYKSRKVPFLSDYDLKYLIGYPLSKITFPKFPYSTHFAKNGLSLILSYHWMYLSIYNSQKSALCKMQYIIKPLCRPMSEGLRSVTFCVLSHFVLKFNQFPGHALWPVLEWLVTVIPYRQDIHWPAPGPLSEHSIKWFQ